MRDDYDWMCKDLCAPCATGSARVSYFGTARMQDFRKLKVWRKAFKLGIDVHRAIENGPRWTYPDLRGQTLRAAASISDTIAEGCGKESPRELARYADMASGSAKELLNQLMRACALNYLSRQKFKEFESRIDEIRRMLWSLAATIRRRYPS